MSPFLSETFPPRSRDRARARIPATYVKYATCHECFAVPKVSTRKLDFHAIVSNGRPRVFVTPSEDNITHQEWESRT